ncbi:hypothetical protein SAMN05443575_4172 [Jatrophihabitans endophyticus]|uniref:SurA N-terminal domain-containing protein n=1 Tax=Jatrophihabitans endophyticus TaxID=1206085 RepID=A0A1M5U906_9ACTN|nr:hypothetical protein [Jatrophihabitans endophyticus]SHH59410.1 hypothetical protein SAMN05443575_4172 [Jatrophihabitans endophyticus]
MGAAVAVVLTAATLTACRTNVGVAARVNGETISESDVTTHLTGKPQSAQLQQQAKAAGQDLTPARVIVLQSEIGGLLYRRALARTGGVPTDAALVASRNEAVQVLAGNGQQITDQQLGSQLSQFGVKRAFTSRFLRTLELEYALIQRLKLTQQSELTAAVRKTGSAVSVSPRYGTWDAAKFTIDTASGAGSPAFLKLQQASSSAAAPGS